MVLIIENETSLEQEIKFRSFSFRIVVWKLPDQKQNV